MILFSLSTYYCIFIELFIAVYRIIISFNRIIISMHQIIIAFKRMIHRSVYIFLNVFLKSGANRTLGFLGRNLYSPPQEVKEAAYKGLMRLILDYGSSVWDPPGVVLQEELERVQKRAARFVTGNYNYETGSMTGILGQCLFIMLDRQLHIVDVQAIHLVLHI